MRRDGSFCPKHDQEWPDYVGVCGAECDPAGLAPSDPGAKLDAGKMLFGEVLTRIEQEFFRATRLYPRWPADLVWAAAIVAEECGELVQAANNHVHHLGSLERCREEAVHTAVTAIRFLMGAEPAEADHA